MDIFKYVNNFQKLHNCFITTFLCVFILSFEDGVRIL